MIYGDRPIKIHLIRALETKCGNLLEVQLAQHKHCWCLYMCTYLFHTLKLLHPHKTTPSNQVLGVQAETWWWLIDLLWLQIIEAEFSDSYWIKEDGFGYLCLLNKLTHINLSYNDQIILAVPIHIVCLCLREWIICWDTVDKTFMLCLNLSETVWCSLSSKH